MKNMLKGFAITIIFILVILSETSFGIEVGALKEMLDRGEKVTIVDIRSLNLYTENHIRDAINISAGIIARKPLPPIGRVIVYGDGIRKDITSRAVEALNSKTGIQAELLAGGFAAWQSLNLPSTQSPGMKNERLRYITYEELRRASEGNQNMVLVDIRPAGKKKNKAEQKLSTDDNRNSFDLVEKFPDLEVISLDPKDPGLSTKSKEISIAELSGLKKSGHTKVYVLVDRGDGKSEKVARRLYGSGIKQVTILVGGEKILQKEGQSDSRTNVAGESL
jgi:rhodanese-related sulfurtransferase